jgi:hypothetical protein
LIVVKVWSFHRDFLIFWKTICSYLFLSFFLPFSFFFPVFLLVFPIPFL